MLEVRVEHLGDAQFEIRTRGHKLISDQPIGSGGYDEGITPPELLLASLGSCAAYYAADYLKRQNITVAGTRVHVTAENVTAENVTAENVTAEKVAGPARLDQFRISVDAPVALRENQEKGMYQAVEHCLIHNTLLHPPKVEITVERAPEALAVEVS